MGNPFAAVPGKFLGTPSGGMFPFSNSAPVQAAAAAPGAAGWSAQFSGVLDGGTAETRPISNFPFALFSMPLSLRASYTLNPADFRDDVGAVGGWGVVVHVQSKSLGFEIQFSSPSTFYVSVFTNYVPIDPDNVEVLKKDYSTIWPPGTPSVLVTFDAAHNPRVFFDGVEATIIDGGPPSPVITAPGDRADVYAYAGLPGLTVDVTDLVISGA